MKEPTQWYDPIVAYVEPYIDPINAALREVVMVIMDPQIATILIFLTCVVLGALVKSGEIEL